MSDELDVLLNEIRQLINESKERTLTLLNMIKSDETFKKGVNDEIK